MDAEDLEPRKAIIKPKDLDALSVTELEDYLGELEAEVVQVKAKIEQKRSYLDGAAAFFKP